jgi:adenosylhomocysteine nucleosidase
VTVPARAAPDRQAGVVPDEPARRHVAVLAPLPLELDAVVAAFGLEPADGEATLRTGRCGGSSVSAHRAGMGPAAARVATTQMFDESLSHDRIVDHVMVVGICGGLDPALEVGTVLAPELVVDLASGATFHHHPPGGGTRSGSLVTTEVITFDPEISQRLAAEGALGIDMETSAVAEVCETRGCPWSVYRCISDRYVDGLLDPRVVALTGSDGEVDLDALTRVLADDPGLVTRLERLGHDAELAARRAAEAALRGCLALDGLAGS